MLNAKTRLSADIAPWKSSLPSKNTASQTHWHSKWFLAVYIRRNTVSNLRLRCGHIRYSMLPYAILVLLVLLVSTHPKENENTHPTAPKECYVIAVERSVTWQSQSY